MNPGEAPEETWTSEVCQAYLDKTWSSSSFVKVYHYEQHDVVNIDTLEDDKKQALRTQVIAMLEQRRGRTLPEEARVYVGDASPYILTELDDAISVMQLQALPGDWRPDLRDIPPSAGQVCGSRVRPRVYLQDTQGRAKILVLVSMLLIQQTCLNKRV